MLLLSDHCLGRDPAKRKPRMGSHTESMNQRGKHLHIQHTETTQSGYSGNGQEVGDLVGFALLLHLTRNGVPRGSAYRSRAASTVLTLIINLPNRFTDKNHLVERNQERSPHPLLP